MTEAGHTPWKARDITRLNDDGSSELLRIAIVDAAGGEIVADVRDEVARDLIIRAVNSHAAMLEALEQSIVLVVAAYGEPPPPAQRSREDEARRPSVYTAWRIIEAARAALSQATGKE